MSRMSGSFGGVPSPSHMSRARVNRSAFCESCFNTLFQVCHFCTEPLDEDEPAIHVKHAHGKRPYHRRCYQCVVCLQVNTIDDKLYAGDDDDCLYCYRHYVWKVRRDHHEDGRGERACGAPGSAC